MKALLDRGYNVVANALEISTSNASKRQTRLVDGSIAAATAANIVGADNKANPGS